MSDNLINLVALEYKAKVIGFNWPNTDMIIQQVISECDEIKQVINNNEPKDRLQDEIGDLLHSAISLCIFAGFDVEETLAKITQKFGSRLAVLEKLMYNQGLKTLESKSFDEQLELWHLAKTFPKVNL